MYVCNLYELPSICPKGKCLLGIDYGSKSIGLAISDPAWKVASPLVNIKRSNIQKDIEEIADIVKERNIGAFIAGLPKTMEGKEKSAAQAVRTFMSNLLKSGLLPELPVVFWDERLSTAAVERFMIEDDMTRKRRREVIDKAAAAYILQGALDALSFSLRSK